jgi:hypothetical protein
LEQRHNITTAKVIRQSQNTPRNFGIKVSPTVGSSSLLSAAPTHYFQKFLTNTDQMIVRLLSRSTLRNKITKRKVNKRFSLRRSHTEIIYIPNRASRNRVNATYFSFLSSFFVMPSASLLTRMTHIESSRMIHESSVRYMRRPECWRVPRIRHSRQFGQGLPVFNSTRAICEITRSSE